MQPPTTMTQACPRSEAGTLRGALRGDPRPMHAAPATTPTNGVAGGAHTGEAP